MYTQKRWRWLSLIVMAATVLAMLPGFSLAGSLATPTPAVLQETPLQQEAPPRPEPRITTGGDQAAAQRLSPTLRELAAKGSDEVVDVSIWAKKGTDIKPFVVAAVQGMSLVDVADPTGKSPDAISAKEMDYYAAKVNASNLSKLAGTDGVIMVSYVTAEAAPPRYQDPDHAAEPADYAAMGARLAALRDNPPAPTKRDAPSLDDWYDIGPGHESQDAWNKGYTGAGVRVAVLDTGSDMAHPDLMGTQARQPHVGNPAYWDWPISFDPASQLLLAYEVAGAGNYITEWGWNSAFAYTGWTATGVTLTLEQAMSDGTTFTGEYTHTGITSQSGTYHIGLHPDWSLESIWGEPVAVLVVDEVTAGVYDTVYVDLDNDHEFGNDKPCRKGDEIAYWDADIDGYGDLSGGMVYWITDGTNPVPFQYWGSEDIILPAGDLVLFHINDPLRAAGDHGTLCASNVTGQGTINGNAPSYKPAGTGGMVWGAGKDAELVPIGNIYYDYEASTEAAWLFGVLGYDSTPNTGDEIQIMSNSYGESDVDNDDWDYRSRYLTFRNMLSASQPSPVYLFSTGNGAPGYGTASPPSGLTVISVGASTQFGSTGDFDSITDTAQIVWGDIIGWSNRGPSSSGHLAPHVAADGAFGAGALPLNEIGDGWTAWASWGGTSRSTPVAAANLALVYQAFKEKNGSFPTYDQVRQIVMAGATDRYHDTWMQGAGTVNADRATDIAAGLNGVYLSPDSLSFGDYQGTRYPAFAEIMVPGSSDTQTFEVINPTAVAVTVNLADTYLTRIGEYTFTLTTQTANESDYDANRPDYLFDVNMFTGGGGIPAGTDLMMVELLQDRDQMDVGGDYSYDDMWRILVYNWTDVNSNGRLWADANSNNAVNEGEIDAGEYIRFSYGYSFHVYKHLSVYKPLERMDDGLFVGLLHRNRAATLTSADLKIRVSYWKRADWPWLSLGSSSVTVPAGGTATFDATMAVPANADLGAYEGGILVTVPVSGTYEAYTFIAPVAVNVAGQDPAANVITLGGNPTRAITPYDNSFIRGGQDWEWRAESGDWRFYFLDQTTPPAEGTRLFIRDTWDDAAPYTDLDTLVFGPTLDYWSTNYPTVYGPYTLDLIGGSVNTHSGTGEWAFETATGTNEEIIVAPLYEGLNEIVQHSVDWNGDKFEVNFTKTVGAVQAPESLVYDTCCVDDVVPLTSTVDIPEGMTVTAYGIETHYTLLIDEPILQDDPDDSCTASWTQQIHAVDYAGLDVIVYPQATDDLDLYVLYSATGEPTCPGDIIASSTNPAGEPDYVSIDWPEDGYYAIYVTGWDVPTGESTFAIEIYEDLLNDALQVSNVPTGPIVANTPVQFNITTRPTCQTGLGVDGTCGGVISIGLAGVPNLIEIPVEFTCYWNYIPMVYKDK